MQPITKLLKKILIASIIFTILIALILIYIGPVTTMLVKYKLKKASIDVVVSLTTTPYRIDKIKPVLDVIARQSIKPTRVYINVPIKFKRDNSEYVIPQWLSKDPNIIINRTKDYGPGTKLIATLEKESDPRTIIITIDDDLLYSKHLVRGLIKRYVSSNNSNYNVEPAITVGGLQFIIKKDHIDKIPLILPGQPSLIIIGDGGVAYRRGFFKEDIFSLLDDLPISCFLSDDLMISAYLLAHNVNILKISGFYYNTMIMRTLSAITALPTHSAKDALHNGANGVGLGSNEANYIQCLNALPKYNKSIYKQAVIERSQMITNLYQKNKFWFSFKESLYIFLNEIITIIPFLQKIMIATMV